MKKLAIIVSVVVMLCLTACDGEKHEKITSKATTTTTKGSGLIIDDELNLDDMGDGVIDFDDLFGDDTSTDENTDTPSDDEPVVTTKPSADEPEKPDTTTTTIKDTEKPTTTTKKDTEKPTTTTTTKKPTTTTTTTTKKPTGTTTTPGGLDVEDTAPDNNLDWGPLVPID